MRFLSSVFLLSSLLISSCTNPAQQNQPDVYYDVLGFIESQITDLSSAKPLVLKSTWVDSMFESQWQETRDINWTKEFELFTQVDINKLALRNSYQIARPDSLTYQYTLKKSEEKLTVRSLTVRLDSTIRQPRQIEAVLQTSNPLYSSERHLLMKIGLTKKNQWRVRHYKVWGYQELSFFQKNSFAVEGYIGPRPGEPVQ